MSIAGERFVITGGASQVGRELTQQLLNLGVDHLTLIDNFSLGSSEGLQELNDPRVSLIRGDILRYEDLLSAFQQVDGVFHIAGFLTKPLGEHPSLGLDVNVRGTANVIQCSLYAGVQRLVFSSTTGVYGSKARLDPTVSEDHHFARQGLSVPAIMYSASKIIGEGLCMQAWEESGIGTVALRYSTVYGTRQHERGVNSRYLRQALEEASAKGQITMPAECNEIHDYVYVGDVARANIAAMSSGLGGEAINVASGETRSVADLVKIIGRLLEAPVVDPNGYLSSDDPQNQFRVDISAAERKLRWTPKVFLEDGVRMSLDWEKNAKGATDD